MRRKLTACGATCAVAMFVSAAASQSPDNAAPSPAKFEIADVHPAAKSRSTTARTLPPRDGRYELRNASIVDLIRFAYGFGEDKILGGPSWLEMDRFDIIAKEPLGTTAETRRPMLQSLLADRFKLVVRRDTRPIPGYALTAGKNPRIIQANGQADGTEETGCRTKPASGQPPDDGDQISVSGPNGWTTINLGPGMTVPYLCRNITMAAFAEGLPQMLGTSFGSKRVVDETGLKGAWNFDVKWSMQMNVPTPTVPAGWIAVADAIQKQLGLKLEDQPVPTPVLVVERVNRTPTENPPGVAEALPKIPVATEFEVADIKPSDPGSMILGIGLAPSTWVQPGGRFTVRYAALWYLVYSAFDNALNTPVNREKIAGLPDWANTEQFNINAKVPEGTAFGNDTLSAPLRALLVDRFKMKYHTEDRRVSAYSLVSVKPKMKKADRDSRASCKDAAASPNTRGLTCRNVTMAQFAERLQNLAPELNWPVLDETGIKGTWDFTLTFSRNFGPPPGPGARPSASDPTGEITIFDAVQKQLGLKLESRKRPLPVIVIDHIEQQPTAN